MTSLQFQRLHEHIRSCDARFESLVHHPCFLEYSHGALLQKEMINRIGPKVKQVWNVAYICYIFWGGWVVINTTAYHLSQYSLHLLVLPKELHDIFDCFNWCYYLGTCHWIAKGDDKEQTKEAKVGPFRNIITAQKSFGIILQILLIRGPWWWSSGLSACLILQQSEFEPR